MFDRARRTRGRGRASEDGDDEADVLLGRPRVVVVTRTSDYAQLLAQHGTREQARFFLRTRGQDLDELWARHEQLQRARQAVFAAIPASWRQAAIEREDLHRFVFEPSDVIIALGPDGLVANVAKYLDGQRVIGIDPEPGRNPGVLVPHRCQATAGLLQAVVRGRAKLQRRTMVAVELDDGQRLLALNELFIGHPRHQSARYQLAFGCVEEQHSSSGVVVTTGTGATGWARSIIGEREQARRVPLPGPEDRRLAFFVREAWPSPTTGTSLTAGLIGEGQMLELTSASDEGVIFGDGIEADRLEFRWGVQARVSLASRTLHLVM